MLLLWSSPPKLVSASCWSNRVGVSVCRVWRGQYARVTGGAHSKTCSCLVARLLHGLRDRPQRGVVSWRAGHHHHPSFVAITAGAAANTDHCDSLFFCCVFSTLTEPRILVESTEPLTLDNVIRYADAEIGDCIVEVPEVGWFAVPSAC